MKICFVAFDSLPVLSRSFSEHGIGGEQVQHALLAKVLARRGFDVSMAVYDYGQPEGAVWHGVTTLKLYRPSAGLAGVRFLHPRWTGLVSALKRADSDIYFLSRSGPALGQVALFTRKHNRRLVFRVASDLDCAPGAPLIRYWRDKMLYRFGLRRADIILVQSKQQQEALRRNYGLQSSLASMLVDEPDEVRTHAARDIDVLWVNNMSRIKRPELFVRLAEEVTDASFHMIGGPQTGFEWLFDQTAESAAKIHWLTFHGPLPYHAVGDHYGRARVLVSTSEIEGFPNSYLQAWIRGTPVVTYFDPDGVIAAHGLGQVVRSPEEMKRAVTSLLSDSGQWHATSQRCRAYMRAHYGESQVLAPYLHAFGAC